MAGRPKTKALDVNDEQNIRLGKNGRYFWDVKRVFEDGSIFRKSGSSKDLADAVANRDKALAEYEGALNGARIAPKSSLTVGDWADTCVVDIWPNEVGERTVIGYSDIVRLHIKPEIGDIKLGWLTFEHINKLIAKLRADGKSPQTQKNIRNCISKLYTTAQRLEKVSPGTNPAKLVLIKTKVKRDANGNKTSHKRILTSEECVRLFEAAKGHQYEAAVWLGLFAGLRIGEIAGVRWRSVDLGDKPKLHVIEQRQEVRNKGTVVADPKTDAGSRTIPLAAPLKAWLSERAKGEYVVTKGNGKAATPHMISTAFKSMVTSAKLCGNVDEHGVALADPTLHDLRHTFCSNMANGWLKPDGTKTPSVPLTTLCKIAGHATIEVTAQYYVTTGNEDMETAMANVILPVAA